MAAALRMSDVGRRLLREKVIRRIDFEGALARQIAEGGTLGGHLVASGVLDEQTLGAFLAQHYGVPAVGRDRLSGRGPDVRLPSEMCRYFRVIAVSVTDGSLELAMADPSDTHAIDEVSFATGLIVVPKLALESEILGALDERPPSAGSARPVVSPVPAGESLEAALEAASASVQPGVAGLVNRKSKAAPGHEPRATAESLEDSIPIDLDFETLEEEQASGPGGRTRPSPPPSTSLDLPSALELIRSASSRDLVIELAVRALGTFCRRTAFFVVKKGNIQGWEGHGEGLVRARLRNLWVPTSSASVFKDALEQDGVTITPVYDSTANRILAAALGPRSAEILLAPVRVQGRPLGFLYGDTFTLQPAQVTRIEQLGAAVAEAFERLLLGSKHRG